jgi:hypothetical protein
MVVSKTRPFRAGSQQAESARSCGGHSCRVGTVLYCTVRGGMKRGKASRTGGCVECVMQIVESKRASRGE